MEDCQRGAYTLRMKLLMLGGTLFLGRHVVDNALARGHDVTLFHRGKTGADLFPGIERVLGDRDGGLAPLAGRSFDAVIDTCGYVPRIVRQSAEALAPTCAHYVFVSSCSVYSAPAPIGSDESAPVSRELVDPTTEKVDGDTYGPLKTLCEDAVNQHFPDRSTLVRAGLIVGPHDPTDRFTYWPRRIAERGDVLCPPDLDQQVQLIDVRDLAAWMVTCAEERHVGAFNTLGPADDLTLGEMLARIADAVCDDGALTFRSAPAALLEQHEVAPWMGLPLWVTDDLRGMLSHDLSKALGAGLTFRPLEETARDTLAWWRTQDRSPRAGISTETERAVLAELDAGGT